MSSTDSPLVSTPKMMMDTAMIAATAEISTNTPLDPIDPAATDVTKNGKKILLTRPIALQDRKSTRLNSSHSQQSRMPSSA